MKSIMIIKLSLLSLVAFPAVTQPAPDNSSAFGVFVASTPCDAGSNQLLGISLSANCELIKWRLALYQDPSTLKPSSYQLTFTYGLPQPGTNGLVQGGTKVERQGRWAIIRGTKADVAATVYQLDPNKPRESISFQRVDRDLIHLVDRNEKLVVGNAGWSYTLNRTEDSRRPTTQVATLQVSAAEPDFRAASTLPLTTASSVVGTFVGRSPCREVAAQLAKTASADCWKAKWELTLYQHPVTLIPTTYKLKGTFYRDRVGEGRWAIVRGTKTDPAAVIYQLDPNDRQGSLLLLKADDSILFFLDKERNLLVGNADFSYTLNRVASMLPAHQNR